MIDPDKPMRVVQPEGMNPITQREIGSVGASALSMAIGVLALKMDAHEAGTAWRAAMYKDLFHVLMSHPSVGSSNAAAQEVESALEALAEALWLRPA